MTFIQTILKDHHLIEILRGSSIAFALKGVGAVLSFLLSVYVARLLGAGGAGIFFLTTTIIFIAANLGRFGLDNVVIRLISAHASTGSWGKVKEVFFSSLILIAGFTSGLSLLIYLFAEPVSVVIFDKPQLIEPLKWMTIRIIPLSVITLIVESLRGLKKIGYSQVIENVWTPVLTIMILFSVPYIHTPAGLAKVWDIVAISVMGIAVLVWWRSTGMPGKAVSGISFRPLLKAGSPLFVVSALSLIISSSSTIFLGIFGESKDVGIFNAANRTANLMNFLLVSVNVIAAPKFAELFHQRDFTGLKNSAQDSTRLIFWLSLPVFIGVLSFTRPMMGIFGEQFRSGAMVLAILVFAQFVNISTGSVGYLLMMCHHEKLLRNNILAVAGLNILLCFLIIPRFGMLGAAIVSALSMITQNIVSLILVKQKLHFWTIPLFEKLTKS